MDFNAILWFGIGWFVGGFVNGITGFGAAMAAMPFVTLGMDLRTAVPASALMVLVVSLEQAWRYRAFADWARVYPLLLGAVPGALAGVMALRYLPPQYLRLGLGGFLVLYGSWGLCKNTTLQHVISRNWGYVAGFASTLFGTAFSFNGPPLAVYTSLSGWDKKASKAGLALFFVSTCIIMVLAQALAGLHGANTFLPLLVGVPVSVAGAFLGFFFSRNMQDATYHKLLFCFIALSGFLFSWQGLQEM